MEIVSKINNWLTTIPEIITSTEIKIGGEWLDEKWLDFLTEYMIDMQFYFEKTNKKRKEEFYQHVSYKKHKAIGNELVVARDPLMENQIIECIDKILPDAAMREYMLVLMESCLNPKTDHQIHPIWTGNGLSTRGHTYQQTSMYDDDNMDLVDNFPCDVG